MGARPDVAREEPTRLPCDPDGVDLTRRLQRLGRWCADRGWLVLGAWVLAVLALNGLDQRLPPPAREAFVLEGTGSAQAQTLLNRAFPGFAAQPAPLVVHRDAGLTDPASRDMLAELGAELAAVPDVTEVSLPTDDPDLLASDGRTALVLVRVDERAGGAEGPATAIQTTAEQVVGDRAEAALGGYLGNVISATDTRRSEAIGLTVAAVVLFMTLRRGWPVVIPFVTALASVGAGLAIVGLLERVTFIPDEATILGTMLGLGVGIDYALFLVTRHRLLLRRGYAPPDAAMRTAGTAGAGMVFAGGTLIAAVSGLVLTGISFLAWLGFAAAVIVAIAVLAALTLVPALLGLMGERVLPKRLPAARFEDTDLDHGAWARVSDAVTRRPWTWAIGASVLLLGLAAPLLAMEFGQTDGRAFPAASPAHRSTVLIEDGFGPGLNGRLVVVGQLHRAAALPRDLSVTASQDGSAGGSPAADGEASVSGRDRESPGAQDGSQQADGGADPRAADPRLRAVRRTLLATPGVAAVSPTVVSPDGGVAVWSVTPTTGPADPATAELVDRLRTEVLPAATVDRRMDASVGGVTAAVSDLSERVAERLVPFIAGVVTLSFLLLMLAYRSLVIPLKAAAMNLISIGAAYGVVVAIFQWGWGASLIGLDGPVPIQSFVPMMMFAVLFGLSMDYEVFLLTAFREHFSRTGDVTVAVRRALSDTGQVITSAALIMVGVFGSFVFAEQHVAKMFGIGLATAVAVDATIVRCVLVPSIMVLAARRTFWLPGWLDRLLPVVHVEGDPTVVGSTRPPAPPPPTDPRPAMGVLPLLLGLLTGFAAGLAAPGGSGVVAGVAALAGGVVGWLPFSLPGAGVSRASRLMALVGGVLLAAVVLSLVAAALPPASADATVVAAVALVGVVMVVMLPGLRRTGLPVLFGAPPVVVAFTVLATDGLAAGRLDALDQTGAAVLAGGVPAVVAFVIGALGAAAAGERREGVSPPAPSPGTLAAPAEAASEARSEAPAEARSGGLSEGPSEAAAQPTAESRADTPLADATPDPVGTAR
jgi:RND superfamily putative drug exporter